MVRLRGFFLLSGAYFAAIHGDRMDMILCHQKFELHELRRITLIEISSRVGKLIYISMRRFLLPYILISILLASCSTAPKKPKERVVFASIMPLKYFVDKIAGDLYKVEVTVPPGVGPETYSPTPKQMKMLSEADAYFTIGYLAFEIDLLTKFSSLNSGLKIFQISKGINLIKEKEEDHADHVHLQGIDPHIWSSPNEARIISHNIFEGMVAVDPLNREHYSKNLQLLLDEIDRTDSTITKILSNVSARKFVIFHPALGYFAREYGFEQLPIEFEGKDPSPKHMQELIENAREEKVILVFIQKEFDKRNAVIVAKEIGCKAVQIDPLDYNWPEQMISIASKLAENR
jgi:zinc transport system substrate-binding protein